VRNSAYHVIGYKGATYFAVGLALVKIVGAILRDEHSLLTVSTLLEGEYGLADVCLSVPCLVSEAGVERVIEASLSSEEREALAHSASVLRGALDELKRRVE
jgi:L-lactate dehydrogenase